LVFKNKNSEKGVTLVEILVAIAIITLFSMILIADYPKMKRQFSLSRAVYKFAQDLRKTQDLGLSGVQIKDDAGDVVVAKGYGVYFTLMSPPTTEYKIYADRGDTPDQRYENNTQLCSNIIDSQLDCVVETINIGKEEPGVFIKQINHVDYEWVSINFNPPNPETTIEGLSVGNNSVEVVFAQSFNPLITRTVSINTSGLIEVR